ncbi:DUF3192 domain-containing protein [Thalassotalea sp. M1531]|uniref:DUF3192 domain-containing protein n=1 Tax=Thalassotalea algicola TaxID=2716224 RepID=A0A7Y0LEX5_9GAMM|nr:DUF3192 domain-containing protein [Thalassotalea algicola]NMP33285.1 DUF3192 domain-containing protein [Thalassotalea algicola]
MKKSLVVLLAALPLTFGLTGCVVSVGGDDDGHYSYDFNDREYDNRKKIASLQVNSSFGDVQGRLGVADFNEVYQKDGESIQVLYYRTNRKHKDGVTTKDECTPLIFKNGMLVSWGDTAYAQL